MHKTSWEKDNGHSVDFIQITHLEVVLGTQMKFTSQGGGAKTCPHKDFLNGKFHQDIKKTHGDKILYEVILAVKNAHKNPLFQEQDKQTKIRHNFIYSIPYDSTLENLHKNPDAVNGSENYCNAGTYKTVLKSNRATLRTELNNNYIVDESNNKKEIILPGLCESAVCCNDYFFVVSNFNFFVFNQVGEWEYTTPAYDDFDNCVFGTQVRIDRVYKNADRIFFRYSWFSNEYPSGLIEYKIGEGLCSRWEEK